MRQIEASCQEPFANISSIDGIDLSFFIPGLEKSRNFDSTVCHFSEVSDSFDNQLGEICVKVLEFSLLNYPGRRISREYNSGFTLEHHFSMFDPSLYDEYSVYASGLLREMMFYYVTKIFEIHSQNKNAIFATGEIHWHTPHETMKNKSFLRDFLQSLVNS